MRDSDALENNPHVSRSALEAIHSHVYGWALSRCEFDRAAAEDLMQQAYVEVLSGGARFNNKSSLKTFVFGVVQNLANSRFRRIATRLRLLRQDAQGAHQEAVDVVEPDDNERVWPAVKALPQRQRDIIELVFCREMTIEEASKVMGVSTGTGRVHYDRAKKALRSRLMESLVDTE
jgi:RNA polymerase sigma-70 factor (ECF subfamily)